MYPVSVPIYGPTMNDALAEHTKTCPDCAEDVLARARICRYCRHEFWVDSADADAPRESDGHEDGWVEYATWFALPPIATATLGVVNDAVYSHPLQPLLTFWLLLALVTWIVRLRYGRTIRMTRRIVTLLWVLGALGSIGNAYAEQQNRPSEAEPQTTSTWNPA